MSAPLAPHPRRRPRLVRHDSAVGHVTGQRALSRRCADRAAARSKPRWCSARMRMPASRASTFRRARAAPGVVAVVTAADIPGQERHRADPQPTSRCCRPIVVEHEGQPVVAVAAATLDQARAAAKLVKIDYEPLPAVLTVEEAIAKRELRLRRRRRSRAATSPPRFAAAPHRLTGELRCGGQDHFYLEGQIAARDARRGRRHARASARPSIRPRCSTASRICSACRSTP